MEDTQNLEDLKSDRRQGGRRVTDQQMEELAEFRKEMRRYMSRTDKQMKRGEDQFVAIMSQIARTSQSIQTLDENTKDMIKTYRDYQAAARVGTALQKFVVACVKWGGIMGAIGYGVNWLIVHFTDNGLGQ